MPGVLEAAKMMEAGPCLYGVVWMGMGALLAFPRWMAPRLEWRVESPLVTAFRHVWEALCSGPFSRQSCTSYSQRLEEEGCRLKVF